MSAKVILVFCSQALLIQLTVSQCTSWAAIEASGYPGAYGRAGANLAVSGYNGMAAPMAYDGRGMTYEGVYPTSGRGLPVTSISPISPTGISIVSENMYEGPLSVMGEVPFLSAVAFEGSLPTGGGGAINYGCGNGVTAMISEGIAPASTAFGPAGFGPAGFGPTGFGAPGCGGPGYAPAAAMGPGPYGGFGRGMLY